MTASTATAVATAPAGGAEAVELIFIPVAGVGHVVSTVEIAKLMVDRDPRLSITVLIMQPSSSFDSSSQLTALLDSLSASLSGRRIHFVSLPRDDPTAAPLPSDPRAFFSAFIKSHRSRVSDAVAARAAELSASSSSVRLAGIVLDLFCTPFIDVADAFGLPSYVYFTSGAAFLGVMLYLQHSFDNLGGPHPSTYDLGSDQELPVPEFSKPFPARTLPSVVVERDLGSETFLDLARGYRRTKGIMVNTFRELESYALASLNSSKEIPTVYPVGPVLNLNGGVKPGDKNGDQKQDNILTWLDQQPESSVVFLCFGSMGSFGAAQVQEIAHGLERSGHRFLWSLRRPPTSGTHEMPSDFENPEEVLPEGFIERTAEVGKVIGWAPQVTVLSHRAVGGFVSHCGWNSTLESLWCGVPIATWPIYAEQQANAFQMARELGLAAEITLDYRKEIREEASVVVGAEEIERGIRCAMEQDSEVRKKVRMMSEASRKAVAEGGSSYTALGRFIYDVVNNAASL